MSNNKRDRQSQIEEESEAFSRSKKIIRSPNTNIRLKEQEYEDEIMNEKIESLLQEIKVIREDMKKKDEHLVDMLGEIKEIRKEMRDKDNIITDILEEVKNLRIDARKQDEKWSKQTVKMHGALEKVETKIEKLEKERKKLNVIVKGVQVEQGDNRAAIEAVFGETLGVRNSIKSVRALGKERKVLLVEMESWESKMQIFKNKYKLKETNIFIDNDQTQEEMRIQAELRALAREERNQGKTVKIGYKKILINEEEYVWDKNEEGVVLKQPNNTEHSKN